MDSFLRLQEISIEISRVEEELNRSKGWVCSGSIASSRPYESRCKYDAINPEPHSRSGRSERKALPSRNEEGSHCAGRPHSFGFPESRIESVDSFSFLRNLVQGIGSVLFVSILIEKREGKIAADWLASEALKRHRESDSRLLGQGLFRIADRPMGIETSPFAGAVEINMMSADLRKLSDPQKELEAAEHIPSHKSQAQKAWQVIRQGHYQQQDYVRDVNFQSR
ncbi:hypothetical protein HAX54_029610 [Datura stramonium]|uniref:Uncharacterized protein n=1 Tax=Datura stramonium TaxID=4076 RepID=A0ABS8V8E1_DATST|nr:hypothetical protein [Datura stramonium]